MYIVTILVIAAITFLLYLYWNLKKAYRFFDENGIPNIKPTSILGNMPDVVLFRKTIFDGYLELYKKAASYKFVGFYNLGKPFIMVRDPELIKQVLIKDFDHFQDHTFKINEKVEPLTNNLFSLKGEYLWPMSMKISLGFQNCKIFIHFITFIIWKFCQFKQHWKLIEISQFGNSVNLFDWKFSLYFHI